MGGGTSGAATHTWRPDMFSTRFVPTDNASKNGRRNYRIRYGTEYGLSIGKSVADKYGTNKGCTARQSKSKLRRCDLRFARRCFSSIRRWSEMADLARKKKKGKL